MMFVVRAVPCVRLIAARRKIRCERSREPEAIGLRGGLQAPPTVGTCSGSCRRRECVMPIGRLHVITDHRPDRDTLVVVEAALEAGAPVVQVRAKALGDRALYELTCRVVELCAARDVTCIVNDRVDVALAAGAHGVHVGADDLPVAVARRVLGPDRIVGATARDPETARAHQAAGASYIGVGPCFATSTKKGLPDPIGCAGVRAVSAAVTIPVIAIAGVTAGRVSQLVASGAYGVAVVGAVWDAVDPHAAVGELVACLDAGA